MEPGVQYEVVAHEEEIVDTELPNDSNPIQIDVEEQEEHHAITTIQLQSPGGSSHIVEGLMVTTSSQIPGQNHLTLSNGNTFIIGSPPSRSHQNEVHHGSLVDGETVVLGNRVREQLLCTQGIQLLGVATNQHGETIIILPKAIQKQETVEEGAIEMISSESVRGISAPSFVTEQLEMKAPTRISTSQPQHVILRATPIHEESSILPISCSAEAITSAVDVKSSSPTLLESQSTIIVVSGDSETNVKPDSAICDEKGDERPKRKAALKAIAARKAAKKRREKLKETKTPMQGQQHGTAVVANVKTEVVSGDLLEDFGKENNDPTTSIDMNQGELHNNDSSNTFKDVYEDDAVSSASSDDEDETKFRRCIVCLRRQRFTEDIFDSSKTLYYHIDVLIAHLNIQVKGTPVNTGMCPECMNYLQRWHVFNCAVVKRHEQATSLGVRVIDEPISYQSLETKIYKNFKKMARVKEVYNAATHSHYARRYLTEKDWDFFCDHLFRSNSVKSEKSRELEKFLTSKEKLSHLYCMSCQKLISNGKKGYLKHMLTEHKQTPVMFPCDICGQTYPEKDMTASTEDYYPHWISHFYFNKCGDCGKTFPTKRALGQHRHAVHKNRQVKCDKCGKVLANKMSLDLHLLRHLPETEKKKYMIKCKLCKKKIAQWNLKSHMATHNDERPWKCDHCDATFKMKGALVSHRDVVHFNLKNHVCPICGDAFKSASSLRGHVRRHEGRKDYKCDVCHKEYYTYSALKGHKVVHQTARDFVCSECGKAFKKRKALEEHATIHTGEKPHRCPICGREVRVKSNLYKHMKIHKKNPNPTIPKKKASSTPSKIAILESDQSFNGSILTGTAKPDAHGTMTVTLDGTTLVGDNIAPFVVSIVTAGSDGLPSNSSVVELSSENQAQILNAVVQSEGNQNGATTTTYLTPHHFQTTGGGNQTGIITMQHQHQDLLNVPLQNGHYYTTTPQFYTTLDQ